MANPSLLFLDTDVLIQLFLGSELRVLRELKKAYGITPTIVPEVELEVSYIKRFGSRFDAPLRKSIANGTITLLDEQKFGSIMTSNAALSAKVVGKSYADIQKTGLDYSHRVGSGEAYTHATAVSLEQPAASNDWNAIQTLANATLQVSSPVLRTYDLVVFGYQTAIISEADCDRFRKALLKENEFITPRAFQSTSFQKALKKFVPRLCDASAQLVGAQRVANDPFSKQIVITKLDS